MFARHLSDQQLIVLANREPYTHDQDCATGQITFRRSSCGVVNAVEPLIAPRSGVWVAHGSGGGDRATATDRDGLLVPPDRPTYRLRRVWLTEAEELGYYDGFANSALWPLCHRAYVRPTFNADDFRTYRTVNRRFAAAVCDEATTPAPVVLVQDYHFTLAPLFIRKRLAHSTIVTFWHIPWPAPEMFGICPWKHQILEGLLGSDIVGLQTPRDCLNFLDSVEQTLGAAIDRSTGIVTYENRRTVVRDYPVSIEWPGHWTSGASVESCRQSVRRDLRLDDRAILALGVARFDYTKGIEEQFLAVERLLETHPELRRRFTFVQLAQPSRHRLPAYRSARLRVLETAARINRRFSAMEYSPILVLEANHSQATIARHFRAADMCVIGSLHDGMNLVSKEFVAARDDDRGVLVLSEFAGAAEELSDALMFNPYDSDAAGKTLLRAATMSPDEQRLRMRCLRATVARHNAAVWGARILADAAALTHDEAAAAMARGKIA